MSDFAYLNIGCLRIISFLTRPTWTPRA
ncbi:unnamed protein product, partial [Vitis vinifera]|uniref:Uncharacterized protein n=1 Tax=Vitis vinifera TaxID=29760 RepID=D7TIN9_VITVI